MTDETEGGDGEWPGAIETAVALDGSDQGTTCDEVFDLLSRCHRRFVLYNLHHEDGAMDVHSLADAVARLFEASSSTQSPDHDRMQIVLAHTTLPRLADAGVIVYDRDAGVVWPTDAVDAMEPLLELASELDFGSKPPLFGDCTAD